MKRKRSGRTEPQLSAFAARRLAAAEAIAASQTASLSGDGVDVEAEADADVEQPSEVPSDTDRSLASDADSQTEDTIVVERQTVGTQTAIRSVHDDGLLIVALDFDEQLTLHGCGYLRVLHGNAEVLGAELDASDNWQAFASPKTGGLIAISCIASVRIADPRFDGDVCCIIAFRPTSVAQLRMLGNYGLARTCFSARLLSSKTKQKRQASSSSDGQESLCGDTFEVVSHDPSRSITCPQQWREVLGSIAELRPQVTLVAGAKNCGKSTMARYLLHRLSRRDNEIEQGQAGVLVIDLDPGQPDFGTPGTLSATAFHPVAKVLGASSFLPAAVLTNATAWSESRWFGDVTAREDPKRYLGACDNLLAATIPRALSEGRVVVVNTAGWIKGTGLDLLCAICAAIGRIVQQHRAAAADEIADEVDDPNDFHLVHLGSSDLPDRLRAAALPFEHHACHPYYSGSSTGLPPPPLASAADLRLLNLVNYFHRVSAIGSAEWAGDTEREFDDTPLIYQSEWRIQLPLPASSETGDATASGLAGVYIPDHQVEPRDLVAALNGALCAILAVRADHPVFSTARHPSAGDAELVPSRRGLETGATGLQIIKPARGDTLLQDASFVACCIVKGFTMPRRRAGVVVAGAVHLIMPISGAQLDAAIAPPCPTDASAAPSADDGENKGEGGGEAAVAPAERRLILCTGKIDTPTVFLLDASLPAASAAPDATAAAAERRRHRPIALNDRPYLTDQQGKGVGWQGLHVRRNLGRRNLAPRP